MFTRRVGFLFTAILFPALAQAQVLVPPRTLVAHSQASRFPDGPSYGFEAAIHGYTYAPTWAPWTMSPLTGTGGAGIAYNGASLLAQSNPAPEGTHVAFLQGDGTASFNYTFQAGLWQIRFLGAERIQGTTPDTLKVKITVGSQTVFAQPFADGTFPEYITEPVRIATAVSLPVVFGGDTTQTLGNVALIDRVLLDCVQPWQATTTWGDVPPTDIDTVSLDPDAAVYLSGTCAAATVEVKGTLLADAANGSLATGWLYVHGLNSRFRVGTELTPFANQFTLTLTGAPTTDNPFGSGTKFLMALDGGHVDMHGQSRKSWTKLTSVNGTVVKFADAVDWQVNDQIVVARTSIMHVSDTLHSPES